MELVELGPLTAAQVAELEGDEVDPYGSLGSQLVWRPKDHHVGLQDDDGRLVAAAGWLIADVEAADTTFPVVGIGGVIVAKPVRGQGLGGRVIDEVLAQAREQPPALAMLFCIPERLSLYQRRGFVRIADPVQADQPGGPVEMPLEAMWLSLRAEAIFPPGPVRVRGEPF